MAFIVSSSGGTAGAVIGPGPGPGTSTDNALARWNGTTGTAIQNSGAILDDSNNLTGIASLTVTTLVATTTVTTGDNIIRLNDDIVGAPTEDAGIEVERGASTDATLLWDETNDYWVAGLVGSTAKILLSSDSTTDLPEGSNLYFTDERAQDAVGTILVDSASVDLTYNDGVPSITADVLPGGVDHDALLNFVANEHVDHLTVSLLNGTGISATGLGDLTASRTINLADTAVTPASYGSATQVGTFTVDAQGRLTAAANAAIAITSAAVTDFNEAAQDAVGGILTDTASVDFTYSDGGNTISAVVLPAGVDHGGLGGLGDDDHTQYALLAGRSGGQTLIGGTASGNDLTLQSTSNATRGHVFFGSAQLSGFDEVNSRLGIGTTAPTGKLHVTETATTGTVVPTLLVTPAAHTALTASTEKFDVSIANTRTQQWATGALTVQRFVNIGQPTIGFVGASTVTEAHGVYITGAPIKGTNTTLAKTTALTVSGGAVSTAALAYGIECFAPSGATQNYAARFEGRVGIGTATPVEKLHVYTGGTNGAIAAGVGVGALANNASILAGSTCIVVGENESGLGGNNYLSGYRGAVGAGYSSDFNSQWGRLLMQYKMPSTDTTTFVEVTSPQRFTISSGNVCAVNVRISGMEDDGSDGAYYQRMVLIKNVAGTTSLTGAVQTIGTDIESDAAWDVQLTADNGNDSLKIEVKGNTQNINWMVLVDYMQYSWENIA